ncbi:ArsC/Spx/MgsR family protein [Methyloversatilis discipulorum]|uniref:ArsC/Spx/MgsR family protein n=1 Tax=Methyloversatilis discipulorum TaxID=1119528 RepID=UPI00045EAF89|nr:ArsC/Spx/MgsR family protein [Methyloversatilis discipulorum]
MAHIVFFEKPGCAGNARQKQWLRDAGHQLSVRSLLTEPWTAASLLDFLDPLPVADWFNRVAPRVKSGEVQPEQLGRTEALALLLAEPLLIRRPLLQVGAERRVGFDPPAVDRWIGLTPDAAARLRETSEGCAAGSMASCRPTE